MKASQQAVMRVEAALQDVAGALAAADLDRLLAAETVLGDALGQVGVTAPLDASEHAGLREAIDRAYATLLRCRRLGAGLTAFARASGGPDTGYGRSGFAPDVPRATSVEMRG